MAPVASNSGTEAKLSQLQLLIRGRRNNPHNANIFNDLQYAITPPSPN